MEVVLSPIHKLKYSAKAFVDTLKGVFFLNKSITPPSFNAIIFSARLESL
jgi:hypothetical protein